jgi:hypothetical protein
LRQGAEVSSWPLNEAGDQGLGVAEVVVGW